MEGEEPVGGGRVTSCGSYESAADRQAGDTHTASRMYSAPPLDLFLSQ